jgi:hypothetical protein
MTRNIWKPALALGAVLAVSGIASAADRDTLQLSGGPAATVTLGGTGTAAQAATEDLELTGGYRYGGYRGWGGGYGYRGYYGGYRGGYYGGYRGGYYGYRGGYYGGYRPYYGYSSFSFYRPAYYYPRYYYPAYYYPRPVYYGPSFGFYIGISGNATSVAPTVPLGDSFNFAPPVEQPAPEGTFPYDGGPSNPVPLPNPDAKPAPPAIPEATDLPVSGKAKPGISPAKTPYKYKAYGEK